MQTQKNKSNFWSGFGPERLRSHFGLLLFSLIGCGLAYIYESTALLTDVIALGTAYVSLVLLVATLSIGPLNLMLKRRNAVNLDLRRDVGIWAGITGCVHAFFSLQLYNKGNILLYFFNKQGEGYTPQLNLFGLSNLTGLVAAAILLVLLLLSNNLSLRWLKGKRWKFVQRFNYPLFILVVVHTIGYQVLNQRQNFFTFLIIALVFFTVESQLVGVVLSLVRDRKREVTNRAEATPTVVTKSQSELEQATIARRRFLILTGVTLLTGVSSVVALSAAVAEQNKTDATAQAAGNVAPPTPANGSGTTGSNPAVTAPSPTNAAPPTTTASGSDTTGSNPAVTTPTAGVTPPTSNSGGTVLASLSSLPVGAATTFTTPDSGETAFLIHEQDGSVKAFSNICTHRPYELTYQQDQQVFYCPLHAATFDVNSGQVTGGPARYGLKSFKVQVDSQGKVVYIQS